MANSARSGVKKPMKCAWQSHSPGMTAWTRYVAASGVPGARRSGRVVDGGSVEHDAPVANRFATAGDEDLRFDALHGGPLGVGKLVLRTE